MVQAIKKILLVDDEKRLLNSVARRLALLGIESLKASSGKAAVEIAKKTNIDLAIVDLNMPDMDGLTTIIKLKKIVPDLKTVLLTGYGSEDIHEKTDALGTQYFEKDSMDLFWDLIGKLNTQDNIVAAKKDFPPKDKTDSARVRFIDDGSQDKKSLGPAPLNQERLNRFRGDLPRIIGETPKMQRLRKDISRLSNLDCTIIIQGEDGTGKELAARTIHRQSHRSDQRFLPFNCGCFSREFHFYELLGSLEGGIPKFGKENSNSPGDGFTGTVLLDHFDAMPEQAQLEMIRIMDRSAEGELGWDIRFIVATHRDLKKRVANGKFSSDLYRKLNAMELDVPPLRERREDIFPLCSYFLSHFKKEFRKNIESISEDVFSVFMTYDFPGNVRELKHIIERAVILANGATIDHRHLPERFTQKKRLSQPGLQSNKTLPTLDEIEKAHILEVLKITKGNKSKAADALGISRAALWRKLKSIDTG